MKLKKVKSLMVMALAGCMLISGCGKQPSPSSNSESGSSTQSEAGSSETGGTNSSEVVELRYYCGGGEEDLFNNPVAQAITAATGVKLKIEYSISSDDQKIPLMIAEQDYPDLIFSDDGIVALVEAGALIDMTDLIEEYGPNIKRFYGEELDKLKYSTEDPSIYTLSSYGVGGVSYKTDGTMQMQWDVIKENDYNYPKNLEEYENMLKSYIAEHPATEDGLETIGLTLSAADWRWMITLGNPGFFINGGQQDNGQWYVDEDYNLQYHFFRPEEKEYYRWLNRMFNEGILDNEFPTQTHEDYVAKIASGRVLSIMDAEWDYWDAIKILQADEKYGKTYAVLPFTADESLKCASLMYRGLITGQGIGISTSCKDPVLAIKFLDYMCSDEGMILRHWGIEGENYFLDEEGHRYRTEEEIQWEQTDKDYKKKTGVGNYEHPFPRYGDGVVDPTGSTYTRTSRDAVIAEYNEEQRAACEAWNVELLVDIFPQPDEFKTPLYSPSWAYAKTAEYEEIVQQLDEITWSGLISSVICKPAEFDAKYDKMLADLEAAGMSRAGEILGSIIKEKVALVD